MIHLSWHSLWRKQSKTGRCGVISSLINGAWWERIIALCASIVVIKNSIISSMCRTRRMIINKIEHHLIFVFHSVHVRINTVSTAKSRAHPYCIQQISKLVLYCHFHAWWPERADSLNELDVREYFESSRFGQLEQFVFSLRLAEVILPRCYM